MKEVSFLKIVIGCVILTLCSCSRKQEFILDSTIQLSGITPLGLFIQQDTIWVTDSDRDALVAIDFTGGELYRQDGLDRPMHLDINNGRMFIPSYGSDAILVMGVEREIDTLDIGIELDAPAGISVDGKTIAIADFYNHRIVYTLDGSQWLSIGTEGNAPKEFYYPTDVSIHNGRFYVADAYNNRVQVFLLSGELERVIGEADELNAATGIYVDVDFIYITDFENDRVLLYSHKGKIMQEIATSVNKPTDIFVDGGYLYIANYGDSSIARYRRQK